jgi:hypothetical protein
MNFLVVLLSRSGPAPSGRRRPRAARVLKHLFDQSYAQSQFTCQREKQVTFVQMALPSFPIYERNFVEWGYARSA